MQWVGARDAAKHPPASRRPPSQNHEEPRLGAGTRQGGGCPGEGPEAAPTGVTSPPARQLAKAGDRRGDKREGEERSPLRRGPEPRPPACVTRGWEPGTGVLQGQQGRPSRSPATSPQLPGTARHSQRCLQMSPSPTEPNHTPGLPRQRIVNFIKYVKGGKISFEK